MNPAMTSHAPTRRFGCLRIGLIGVLVIFAIFAATALSFIRNQSDPGPPVSGVTEVAVRDNSFGPGTIEVPVGTTVTWKWEGRAAHNVVGDGFESPVQTDGEFSYTFTEPGTYPYTCTLHPFMDGEVIVREEV